MSLLLLAIACGGTDKDTGTTAPPINQDTDTAVEDCDGAAPTVDEVLVSNGGVVTFDDGDFPTVLVEGRAVDTDNDLHLMRMDVWFDTVVDGAVDTAGERIEGAVAQLRDEPCSVGRGTYGLRIPVGDGRLDPNALYEFGVVVYDAHDAASGLGVGSGYTPREDGTDGGPAGG
jgi:hypothetical protein